MRRDKFLLFFAGISAIAPQPVRAKPQAERLRTSAPQNWWDITSQLPAEVLALRRMQTIKPGMTRMQLLQVFTTPGGLSRLHRGEKPERQTFVSQDCPYLAVDVELRTTDRPESGQDVIVQISPPYFRTVTTD